MACQKYSKSEFCPWAGIVRRKLWVWLKIFGETADSGRKKIRRAAKFADQNRPAEAFPPGGAE